MLAWFRQLNSARSVVELIKVVREFLATWSPTDLARLPEHCRPDRMKTEQDLEDLHTRLVETFRTSAATGEDLAMLQRMTSFVVRAAVRLSELREQDGSGEGGHDPEPPSGPVKRSAAARGRH